MSSLKQSLRTRLLIHMIQSIQPASRWKILITDPQTLKILNSACRMHDILEENVTLVEDITRKRQPYPNKEAVYFITPSEEIVGKLIADFSQGGEGKKKKEKEKDKEDKGMYAAAHIFFSAALPDYLFDKIKSSPASGYIKTLKEMNVDFIAYEPQVFTLDQPQSFHSLYNPKDLAHQVTEIGNIAKRLTSVLATLGDYPYIRYYDPPSSSSQSLSSKLAHALQSELDALSRLDSSFPPPSPYKRPILLILDRSFDMVSPLVHEFTYQAMLADLVEGEAGRYLYKSDNDTGEQQQQATLDDQDPIWMLIRHWHYADAVEYIRTNFNKFLMENKAARGALEKENQNLGGADSPGGGIDSLKHMKETLSHLPQFQELKSKFSIHINICQDLKTLFERHQLDLVAGVEQDLATGQTLSSKPLKPTQALLDLVPPLDSPTVTPTDKLRLLMLYIITQGGIDDEERRRLLGYAKLNLEDSAGIINLGCVGVRLSKNAKDKTQKDVDGSTGKGKYGYYTHWKDSKSSKKSATTEESYELSRWIPILKTLLTDQIFNRVDESLFTWVTEPPAEDLVSPNPSMTMSTTAQQQQQQAKQTTQLSKNGIVIPNQSQYPNSLRTTRASWSTSAYRKRGEDRDRDREKEGDENQPPQKEIGDPRKNGPRIIVFCLGGLTFSEVRASYEVASTYGRDVIGGGTCVWSPRVFVDVLKRLGKGEVEDENVSGNAKSGMERSETMSSLASHKEGKEKEKGLRGMFGKRK